MNTRHRDRRRASAAIAAFVLVALGCTDRGASAESRPQPPRAPIRVAAASDLTDAFTALGRAFDAASGETTIFTFGSSGLLASQVGQGAPFDVFASANGAFVDGVVAAGACDGATRARYGLGRLAVWTRAGGVAPPASLADLADARFERVAIANPEHAPYGRAAREALMGAGVLPSVAPKLVLAENVRQALQFAETGNVDAAIVAWSLVVNASTHPVVPVDAALHAPIEQVLVVCTRGDNRAGGAAFARYLASPTGREAMRRFGFSLPDPSAPR